MGVVEEAKTLQEETNKLRLEASREKEEAAAAAIEAAREKMEAEEAKQALGKEAREAQEAEDRVRGLKASAIWQSKFKSRHVSRAIERQSLVLQEATDEVGRAATIAEGLEQRIGQYKAEIEANKRMMEAVYWQRMRIPERMDDLRKALLTNVIWVCCLLLS